MAKPIRITPQLSVDASGLRALSAAIRSAGPSYRALWRTRLAEAGEIVAVAARANASSARVAGTTKVSVQANGVTVSQGGVRAPHAAALENRGQSGMFRHPVFGRDVWVEQQSHPSLVPAAEANVDRVADKLADVIDDYARTAGFK